MVSHGLQAHHFCNPPVTLFCYPCTVKSREERQWELMREALLAEAQGKTPRPVASKRTLFGIRSSVEEAVDKIAAEEDMRCQRIIDKKRDESTR